jgi:pimeloyl-ACP methyl ester carboxylesterase
MLRFVSLFVFIGLLWAGSACVKNNADRDVAPFASVTCDTCKYPIIMVHGFLASGDTWTSFLQRFHSNGYRPSHIRAFDWNSLSQNTAGHVAALDALIDEVRAATGQPKVRLMGHSAGGGLSYTYLSDAVRAAKVDGYVHIGSSVQSGPAGPAGMPVATLNVWSPADAIANGGNITGAENAEIPGKDHYQIATSTESFAAIYAFFHGGPPPVVGITPESPLVCIAGRVVTFGENTPMVNAQVEIFEVNPTTGQRVGQQPFETHISNAQGYWGPTNVEAMKTYEFKVTSATASDREIHYFREGFTHLNTLVYLRTIAPPPSLAGILLAGLPNTPNQTVLNIFMSSQGILAGRDTLVAAGSVLSTPQYAPASKTAIDYFLYDDGDGTTELTPVGLFGNFPFLNGVDMFFPTTQPATIPLTLNSRTLNVRNIPANEGIVVGVFD